MSDKEFKRYVELIASMSIDYMTKGKLTRETYLSNIEMMVRMMKNGEQK